MRMRGSQRARLARLRVEIRSELLSVHTAISDFVTSC
jgi:hypothetical protein